MKPWLFLHHRSASTWVSAFVSEYAQRIGLKTCGGMNSFRGEPLNAAVKVALEHPWALDMNAWPFLPAQLDRFVPREWKAVHIVRDPRDVLISAYYSCRDFHPTTEWPELAPFKAWLKRVDRETGIIGTMAFVSFVLESYAGWEARENILEIRYESLFASTIHHPGEHLSNLLALIEWLFPVGFDVDLVRELSVTHDWENYTNGRKRGDEDTTHHYRKGIAGEWERHWTPRIDEIWTEAYP